MKVQHREKFLRNLAIRQSNEAKLNAILTNHSEELTKKTLAIDELSKQLSQLTDTHQRYRSLTDQRNFFELYERLCRECEKLRTENEHLQLLVGPVNQ